MAGPQLYPLPDTETPQLSCILETVCLILQVSLSQAVKSGQLGKVCPLYGVSDRWQEGLGAQNIENTHTETFPARGYGKPAGAQKGAPCGGWSQQSQVSSPGPAHGRGEWGPARFKEVSTGPTWLF